VVEDEQARKPVGDDEGPIHERLIRIDGAAVGRAGSLAERLIGM